MVSTGNPVIAAAHSRRAGLQVHRQIVGAVRVATQIVPVGEAFREQHVHHRAGKRAVRARARRHVQVRLLGRRGAVRVDHDERGAALLRRHRVGHDVDLRVYRVAAPDHHQVGVLRRLAQIHAALGAHAGDPAGVGQRHADGRVPARILHRVAQPLDAVALDEPHRSRVEVRPHRLGAVPRRALHEGVGDAVERLVPADALPLPGALRSGAKQRVRESIGVMNALGVACDLLADRAGGVRVAPRATDAADRAGIDELDLERAGTGAVVRTDRRSSAKRGVHRCVSGQLGTPITRIRVFRVRWSWSSVKRTSRTLMPRSPRR